MLDSSAEGVREPSTCSNDSVSVRFGPFVFDREFHALHRDGEELVLPLRSLLVLDVLLRFPGRQISRDHLIDEVWRGDFVTDTSLTEAVSRLRRILGDGARQPRYIQTVHGRGYKFIAPLDVAPIRSPALSTVDRAVRVALPRREWLHTAIAAFLLLVVFVWIGVAAFTPGAPLRHPLAASKGPAGGVAEKPKEGTPPLYRLAEVTMSGEPRILYGFPPLPLDDLSVDPIGGRLALSMRNGTGSDVWMLQPSRGVLQRIASGGHFSDPVWTHDGRGLALAHNRNSSIDLMYGELDSEQRMEVLLEAPFDQFPESWSADGRSLVFSERHPETGFDLWLLQQQDDGRWLPTPLVRTKKQEAFGAISPDGRYVAYMSTDEEGPEVFALALERSHQQAPTMVSHGGGRFPFWSAAGDRLHYVKGETVWTLDTDQLDGGMQASARRSTPVAGLHRAAASSIAGRFVVAVLDTTSGAGRARPSTRPAIPGAVVP